MATVELEPAKTYSSYNGLDRVAMFMGIPLLWAVALLTLAVVLMFIGLYFFSLVGFLFILLVTPLIFWIKQISQNDDRALEITMLEMRFRQKRVAYKEFGNTLTFLPERYTRYEKTVQQNFENDFIGR